LGVDLVIIDHLQEIRSEENESKTIALENIAYELRDLALKKNISMMLVSQLNDKQEFKHARVISEVADLAAILDTKKGANGLISTVDIIVVKNRHGATGIHTLDFDFPVFKKHLFMT